MTFANQNPFRSERLRPGAIEYLFADDESVDSLIERLQQNHWRGEIIGPHGTGKSTLVQSLLPRLQALGCAITLGTFQGGQPQWVGFAIRPTVTVCKRVVIIDGFEQLSRLARARWKLYCRLARRGLIVTAHQSMGLPHLYHTSVSPALAEQIIQRIAGDSCPETSLNNTVEALQANHGNMRNVLFAMYDDYEAKRV